MTSGGCHGNLFNLALAGSSSRLALARNHWNCRDRAAEKDPAKAYGVRSHEERVRGVLLDLFDFRMDRTRCTGGNLDRRSAYDPDSNFSWSFPNNHAISVQQAVYITSAHFRLGACRYSGEE